MQRKIFGCFIVMICFTLFGLSEQAMAAGKGYYPDGTLKFEYAYEEGQVREAKWYDEEGRLTARALFDNGVQVQTEGYRTDGSLEWRMTPVPDSERQEVTRFSVDGTLEVRYQVSGDQPDGEFTIFYPDGTPKQTVTYRQGTLDGPAQTFYPSGQVEHEFSYAGGQLEGPYRSFSPEGQLIAEYLFKAGQLQ